MFFDFYSVYRPFFFFFFFFEGGGEEVAMNPFEVPGFIHTPDGKSET
jgi:hypothetical protein